MRTEGTAFVDLGAMGAVFLRYTDGVLTLRVRSRLPARSVLLPMAESSTGRPHPCLRIEGTAFVDMRATGAVFFVCMDRDSTNSAFLSMARFWKFGVLPWDQLILHFPWSNWL